MHDLKKVLRTPNNCLGCPRVRLELLPFSQQLTCISIHFVRYKEAQRYQPYKLAETFEKFGDK